MANEIRIPIIATGGTAAERELGKVADGADNAGDSLKGMADDATALDKAIAAAESSLAGLRMELARTPDDPALRKQVRREEREFNYLSKLRRAITPAEAQAVGVDVGLHMGTGIGDALGALPAQLKGAGIAIGAGLALAAAPFIGSVIGAAVIGGVGAGGIAGGIAAAAQDSRVKSAGTALGESLTESFTGIGDAFVGPLLEQMGRLDGVGSAFFADLGDDIAPLAGHLDDLTDGVAGFARNLDFSKAVAAAGPLIDVIGDELPEVAESLTDALESIAEEGDGLAVGLRNLFDLMESGIRVTGDVVGFLAAVEEGVVDLGSAVGDLSDEYLNNDAKWLFPWLIPLAEGLSDVGEKTDAYTEKVIRARGPVEGFSDGLGGVSQEAEKAAEELLALSDAIDETFGRQMSLAEATSRYKRGVRELRDELTGGRRTLDENTEAGLAHADAIRSQVANIEELRERELEQTKDVRATTAAYEARIEKIRAEAIALGYDKTAVDAIVEAWKGVPRNVETEYRVKTTFYGGGGAGGEHHQGDRRAGGGPVSAGRPYLVGELGPELVTFGAAGTVHTAAQTRAMMSGASGGAATGGVSVVVSVRQSESAVMTAIASAIVPYLQIEVINQGGDVSAVLGAPER